MLCSGAAVATEVRSLAYSQVIASSTVDTGQWAQTFGSISRALEGALAELSALSDIIRKWTGDTGPAKDGMIGQAMRGVSRVSDQIAELWQKIEKDLLPGIKS